MPKCRSCPAFVEFVTMKKSGSLNPVSGPLLYVAVHQEDAIEAEEHLGHGSVRRTVVTDEGEVVSGWAIGREAGAALSKLGEGRVAVGRESHFANCPGAKRHRKTAER